MIRKTLRKRVKEACDTGRHTSVSRMTDRALDYYADRETPANALIMQVAAIAGLLIGLAVALLMKNVFLGPAFGLLGFLLPILFTDGLIERELSQKREHLESAVFLITTLYMKNNELTAAVRESADCFQKDIRPMFSIFLAEASAGARGVEGALANLFRKMPTPELKEWCSQMLLCQEDKSKIESLPVLLDAISEKKLLDEDAALHIADKKKEYFLLLLIIGLSLPVLSRVNPDLVRTMTTVPFGQITLGIFALILILSFRKVYCIGNHTAH